MRSMLLAVVGILAISLSSPRMAFPCTPDANTISVSFISAKGSLISFDASVYNGQCSGDLTQLKVWVNGKYDGPYQAVVSAKSSKTFAVKWDEVTTPGATSTLKVCIGDTTTCDTNPFVSQPAATCSSGNKCKDSSSYAYQNTDCSWGSTTYCATDKTCSGGSCVPKSGCQYSNPSCSSGYSCVNNSCVASGPTCSAGNKCKDSSSYAYQNADCSWGSTTNCASDKTCSNGSCVPKSGCQYSNPSCSSGYTCANNTCVANAPSCVAGYQCDGPSFYFYQYADCSKGTAFGCSSDKTCVNGNCVPKSGCQYNNPPCGTGYSCENNACVASGPTCSAGNKCKDASTVAYQNADCTWSWMTTTCAADSTCSSGACVKKGCKAGFQCINETTYKFTYDDCKETTSYCKAGQVCNATGGPICQCATGNKCKDGSSYAYQDLDCSWGTITTCPSDKNCSGGACVPKSGCQYNNPKCGDGFSCTNNVCVKECNEGFKCLSINTYTFGYKDCSDNGVKTCAPGEVCSDVPGENICIKSQCTSGDCCDKDKQKYLPYGTVCGAQAEKEFGCPQGDGAVFVKSQDKVCSGQYHECYQNSGKWSDWTKVEDCKVPSACVAGQAKCTVTGPDVWSCKNAFTAVQQKQEKFCPGGCKDGKCVVTCSNNADCGNNQFFGGIFCIDKNLQSAYKGFNFYTCVNPGTEDSYCKSAVAVRPVAYCMPGFGVCNGGSCEAYCSAGKNVGTQGYCTKECQCRLKEGHCNSDDECRGNLKCIKGAGLLYGFGATTAVCMSPVSTIQALPPETKMLGFMLAGKAVEGTLTVKNLGYGYTFVSYQDEGHSIPEVEKAYPQLKGEKPPHLNVEIQYKFGVKDEAKIVFNAHTPVVVIKENDVATKKFVIYEPGKYMPQKELIEMDQDVPKFKQTVQSMTDDFLKSKIPDWKGIPESVWTEAWNKMKLDGKSLGSNIILNLAFDDVFQKVVEELGQVLCSIDPKSAKAMYQCPPIPGSQ